MADRPTRRPSSVSAELRGRLDAASRALLAVHKALLDHERARYERQNGPVPSAGQMLQLVIHDPWFAWLHPLSAAIVRLDELAASPEPGATADAEAELKAVTEWVRADDAAEEFQRHYHRARGEAPTVADADAKWRAVVG